MKKLLFFILIISLTMISSGCTLDVGNEEVDLKQLVFGTTVLSKQDEIEVKLTGEDTLYIPGDKEDITVTSWDEDYILIKGTKKVRTNNIGNAESYVDEMGFSTEKISNKVKVQVKFGDALQLLANQQALMEIFIPHTIENIDISTNLGIIDISNLKDIKNISVKNDTGKIYLKDVYADMINLNIGAGDVEIKQFFGEGKIVSSTGQVDISGVKGDFTVETSTGAYRFDGFEGVLDADIDKGLIKITDALLLGESTVRATSGDTNVVLNGIESESELNFYSSYGKINLSIPEDTPFDINATASTGNIRNSFPLNKRGTALARFMNSLIARREVVGKVNGGGPLIIIQTDSGKVTIKKSP